MRLHNSGHFSTLVGVCDSLKLSCIPGQDAWRGSAKIILSLALSDFLSFDLLKQDRKEFPRMSFSKARRSQRLAVGDASLIYSLK